MSPRYQIRSLGLGSIFKFGCLLGGLFSVLPATLCGFGTLSLAAGVRRFLEGWERARISFLGQQIPIDLVGVFRLEPLLRLLQRFDDLSIATLLLLILVGSLIGGVLAAILLWLLGLAYNVLAALTGGLSLDLREKPSEQTTLR